ncbi:Light-sensor Protein kinase [Steccherinum ochraceum]|uniref:Light-sensor Protein kinase n=1 Tax=Steccherinum ochraceum TaxID=92696 RepID=A0A4R0R6X0_9APHY|nr:Light-sensor Protein kinase [Steccherinum ochraceum]
MSEETKPGEIDPVVGEDVSNRALVEPAPASSFVYPVRSLLTGIHAASSHAPNSPPLEKDGVPPSMKTSITRYRPPANVPSPGPSQSSADLEGDAERPDQSSGDVTDATTSNSKPVAQAASTPQKRRRASPNFRDFSKDENPLTPRYFSVKSSIRSPSSESTTMPGEFPMAVTGPTGEPVAYDGPTADMLADDWNPRHPTQLSEVAADAFAASTPAVFALAPIPDAEEQHVSNFSQSGIVHLGPVVSGENCPATRSQSVGSSSRSGGRSVLDNTLSLASPLQHDAGREGQTLGHFSIPSSGSRPPSPTSAMGSDSAHTSTHASSSGSHQITFRYQHMEDENGHHLIVGREGILTKCEDEPIRTPGAVQGFGVLIAVEEDHETGNLKVRQVSENSTELLGLSPQYLFSLKCFSQTLTQQEADQLFDNISYLSDTALTAEEQAENLHVFMLSGWGEPGSALPEEHTRDSQRRRSWSCWCAAHRPEPSPAVDPRNEELARDRNIIILEFELERDTFNPLYPPVLSDASSPLSGVSSPSDGSGVTSDGSGSGMTSDSSGRTLVSNNTDETRQSTAGSNSLGSDGDTDAASVTVNSVTTAATASERRTSSGDQEHEWQPSPEDILASTTSHARPLLALERLRRSRRAPQSVSSSGSTEFDSASSPSSGPGAPRSSRGSGSARNRRGGGGVGMMDVFAVMAQINEQLGAATDLDTFLKVVVGVIKDLTQFHRVLVYQFDEVWNGKVVAELVDWNRTHDLLHGLHFPAADIPPQARQLYAINKVRILYDRGQPTARLVVKSRKDLDPPLQNMTHCYLRAMSPIHIKYLGNMGVRASMSVSIMAFGQLWGLVACHSYGSYGMRVSFPVRQMLRLLSQSISRNVERLSYAQRLHTRKLINTMPTEQHPSGYIVSNADDLLGLFDADFGVLVIGEGAKILGPNVHSQDVLIVAEYLRLKQFDTMQVSQAITVDFPDLRLSTGLEVIAGLLYVPLSSGGRDFIAFLRKGQPCEVKWAGRPLREAKTNLEPRTSFKLWSETVAGRSRLWTDEQLETAGVLALVYGKFIEVWRQKETAIQATKLTNILLSNASHEVRTPLNHIIKYTSPFVFHVVAISSPDSYLELALNGQLDGETRENLSQSHAASKSLLFTINDLLDLTRLESGKETSFNEPFNLQQAIEEATQLYRNESNRRGLDFVTDMSNCPKLVVGDVKKIRTLVANLTANAVKYTESGKVSIECRAFDEPAGLRDTGGLAVEIVVADTGCGIPSDKLESMFREFEQVEMEQSPPPPSQTQPEGLGLGLAVVARIVEQLGGQLRVDSKVGQGSRFSFLIPFSTEAEGTVSSTSASGSASIALSRTSSYGQDTRVDEISNLVHALTTTQLTSSPRRKCVGQSVESGSSEFFDCENTDVSPSKSLLGLTTEALEETTNSSKKSSPKQSPIRSNSSPQLRILIVEDNDINRTILAKRLTLDGHIVVNTTNGQEGLEMVECDRNFDCVLMDIQMPLLNGYEASERIRALEDKMENPDPRPAQILNGRLPIFAVSATLYEEQREEMYNHGMDGWILKPIDFKRLRLILKGVTDAAQREKDIYKPGRNWEIGGWLTRPKGRS